MKFSKIAVYSVVMAVFLSIGATWLYAGIKDEDLAYSLIEYMVAGRIIVSRNQNLINDPAIGFKGFTPDVYEEQVRKQFIDQVDIDITEIKANSKSYFDSILFEAHQSAKKVIEEAQDQINAPNVGFKKFNPAVFADRLCKKFEKKVGITMKLTSLRNRNSRNRPDAYEAKILAQFDKVKDGKSSYDEVVENGKEIIRYMMPVYLDKSCLKCHGEPADEMDISGYKKEGYHEGDLRGAISVRFPAHKE